MDLFWILNVEFSLVFKKYFYQINHDMSFYFFFIFFTICHFNMSTNVFLFIQLTQIQLKDWQTMKTSNSFCKDKFDVYIILKYNYNK